MRRLLRWTFHALTAASLLLCLATAGLWVRSYWVDDEFYAQRLTPQDDLVKEGCVITSLRGRLGGWFHVSERPEGRPRPRWEFELAHADESHAYALTPQGFSVYRAVSHGWATTTWYGSLPDWSLVAAFTALPSIAVLRQIRTVGRRRRTRRGRCPACGYDLRATPDRCPECGTVPAAKGERA